jgi:hypothetical protein
LSELQMGLLGLGVVVIVGVIGYNKWQEHRYRRAARGFESGHQDVLLDQRSATPEVVHAGAAAAEPEGAARIEPYRNPPADAIDEELPVVRVSAPRPPAEPLAQPSIDDRIDFVAELELADAWPVSRIAAAFGGLDSIRTLNCDGYNTAADAWEALVDGADYARFRIGLQLTDRGGPIKETDLDAFRRGIEALATGAAARVRWAGALSPLTNAAELDAFCAEVDVQIGINLVAAASFAETKFRGLAEANGFRREDDGLFRRRDDDGRVLLVLRQSAPAVVSITLDVPRVPRDAAAFGLMAHCARTLAKGLDAKIVDDNQKTLDDATLARIGQGISGIQSRMEAAGLAAGGALALRLFA